MTIQDVINKIVQRKDQAYKDRANTTSSNEWLIFDNKIRAYDEAIQDVVAFRSHPSIWIKEIHVCDHTRN